MLIKKFFLYLAYLNLYFIIMIVFPNAKVNIGLNVVNKRPDGFHDIEAIFYPVGLCDILEFIPVTDKTSNSSLASSGIPVDGNPADNLCLKAYEVLKDRHGLPPIKIHLHKNIPVGSGLGGGSSDAAYMLSALNDYFELNYSKKEMAGFAEQLGSDCAFFIDNAAAFSWGKGEKLEKISLNLKGYYISIIHPCLSINTAQAYTRVRPKKPEKTLKETISNPIATWKNHIKNDFEDVISVQYPVITRIKEELYNNGALFAAMTGSGSSVFGIFKNPVKMNKIFSHYFVWESRL